MCQEEGLTKNRPAFSGPENPDHRVQLIRSYTVLSQVVTGGTALEVTDTVVFPARSSVV